MLKGFIHFDFSDELLKFLILHGGTPAMAHIPTGTAVGAGGFTKDVPMHLQGAHTFLGYQHQIPHLEPRLQGNLGVLKDGMRNDTEAIPILSPARGILADPIAT